MTKTFKNLIFPMFKRTEKCTSFCRPTSIGVRGGVSGEAVAPSPGLKIFRASAIYSKILNDKTYFSTVTNFWATLFFRARAVDVIS